MYILIGVIIWALIWGAVTRQCMVNKGYEEDADAWFIIGLFLGIFAFILAYCKPDIKKQQQEEMISLHRKGLAVEKRKAIRPQLRANRKYQHY